MVLAVCAATSLLPGFTGCAASAAKAGCSAMANSEKAKVRVIEFMVWVSCS